MNVKERIQQLPPEIIRMIIPYSYSPQPKVLIHDLHSYFESKKTICEMFYLRYVDILTHETHADMNWLVNDILCFMNNHRASYHKYCDQLYDICSRNYMLRNADTHTIRKIVNNSYNKNIHFQFRVYWGLLLPEEREQFIKIQKKIRY
jgi:hypothetical protein